MKNIVIKYSLRYVAILFLAIACSFWLFHKKSGFNLNQITSSLGYHKEWAIDTLSESVSSLDEILSQPFYYMKSGTQSYAFVSQDGKYVLKFFRMNHLTPKKWLKFFPIPGLERYKYNKIQRREERAEQVFSGIKKVYEGFREESALLFVHLNQTHHLKKRVILFDRKGKPLFIPLDKVPFILQERAELLYSHLTSLMQQGDKEGAIRALRSLLSMVWRRGERGFIDKDDGMNHNYGFIGERVIQIDIGRLVPMTKEERADSPRLPYWSLRNLASVFSIG